MLFYILLFLFFQVKSDFMQLLRDTPEVHSQARWEAVKDYMAQDPRYQAVSSDAEREAWFDEHIAGLVSTICSLRPSLLRERFVIS